MNDEKIIISLGGSLVVPEEIDKEFLISFKKLVLSYVAEGKKFVVITGGGKICRKYQNVAKEVSSPSNEDLDWIGIASLKLNAELLRVVFGNDAHEKVISNLSDVPMGKPIVIGSAYEPGQSTDWDAVLAAKSVGAKTVINLSNIDYAYDADPKVNKDAKPIKAITWAEYRKLIPAEWNPGLNSPFDPIASKEAETLGLKVVIMNGKNLENLRAFMDGKDFIGTLIS
jgi:uridylate kinase